MVLQVPARRLSFLGRPPGPRNLNSSMAPAAFEYPPDDPSSVPSGTWGLCPESSGVFCHHCRQLVLEGEDCPQCKRTLAPFEPPPEKFDKKGDLHERSCALQVGSLPLEVFLAYLEEERDKIRKAQQLLANEEVDRLLLAASQSWSQALDLAEQWAAQRNELLLQSAIALATQADEQLRLALLASWEQRRTEIKAHQDTLRLALGSQPPPFAPKPESFSAGPLIQEWDGTGSYPDLH